MLEGSSGGEGLLAPCEGDFGPVALTLQSKVDSETEEEGAGFNSKRLTDLVSGLGVSGLIRYPTLCPAQPFSLCISKQKINFAHRKIWPLS